MKKILLGMLLASCFTLDAMVGAGAGPQVPVVAFPVFCRTAAELRNAVTAGLLVAEDAGQLQNGDLGVYQACLVGNDLEPLFAQVKALWAVLRENAPAVGPMPLVARRPVVPFVPVVQSPLEPQQRRGRLKFFIREHVVRVSEDRRGELFNDIDRARTEQQFAQVERDAVQVIRTALDAYLRANVDAITRHIVDEENTVPADLVLVDAATLAAHAREAATLADLYVIGNQAALAVAGKREDLPVRGICGQCQLMIGADELRTMKVCAGGHAFHDRCLGDYCRATWETWVQQGRWDYQRPEIGCFSCRGRTGDFNPRINPQVRDEDGAIPVRHGIGGPVPGAGGVAAQPQPRDQVVAFLVGGAGINPAPVRLAKLRWFMQKFSFFSADVSDQVAGLLIPLQDMLRQPNPQAQAQIERELDHVDGDLEVRLGNILVLRAQALGAAHAGWQRVYDQLPNPLNAFVTRVGRAQGVDHMLLLSDELATVIDEDAAVMSCGFCGEHFTWVNIADLRVCGGSPAGAAAQPPVVHGFCRACHQELMQNARVCPECQDRGGHFAHPDAL